MYLRLVIGASVVAAVAYNAVKNLDQGIDWHDDLHKRLWMEDWRWGTLCTANGVVLRLLALAILFAWIAVSTSWLLVPILVALLLNYVGSNFDRRGLLCLRRGDFSSDANDETQRRLEEANRLKGPYD